MNDVLKVFGVAIVCGMLSSLLLYAVGSKLDITSSKRFYDQCRARWADYESRADIATGSGPTRAVCMVKIDGKWTPEANVMVTP